jgi:hypothetical protein
VALLGRFFGRTASEGAAYAFGVATGPVLAPATETIRQQAWQQYQSRVLGLGDIAGIVAEDVELQGWGEDEASRIGINKERFDALLGEALNAPGLGELYQLWRRGEIDDAGFAHGLRKAKFETRWDAPLKALHDVLLSPDTLANARQQGFVDVARQHSESALQGVTQDRADILFELSGNPPGPETLQRAANRGLVDQATFDQGIREGRTKTKYTDLLWQLRNPLLSAATYVRLYLKGWITQAEMNAGGALWGYTPAQMDDWYLSEGRPPTTRQAFIGFIRGGRVQGQSWDERETHRRAVKQSNLRPEWEPILWAQRYTYPSAFVLRSLTQSGDITQADAEQVLLFSGWEPTLAAKVSAAWAPTGAAKADTHQAKAQTQLWTTTHKSYLAGEISKTQARNALGTAGVAAASITTVLGTWDAEKALIRAQLSAANIKKAFNKGGRNNATGKPWTRDEALAALIELGWAALAANDYLDIP